MRRTTGITERLPQLVHQQIENLRYFDAAPPDNFNCTPL